MSNTSDSSSDTFSGVKQYLRYTIIKLIVFLIFILFFYDIIVKICLFFGIESTYVYLYTAWLIFLLILLTILPFENGAIKYTIKVANNVSENVVPINTN
jgi:succinate dehydrogenase/fumarate reductase cytochrome b subunit